MPMSRSPRTRRLLARFTPDLRPIEQHLSEFSSTLRSVRSGLAETRDAVLEFGKRLEAVERATAELRAELAELGEPLGRIRQLTVGLDALATEARDMSARTYDRLENADAIIADVRAAADYERAWSEEEPLVSVVIATYNGAEVLCERALASVRAQTYQRWEAMVVGDACTDETAARIAALEDQRISFINLPVRGPYPEDAIQRWRVAGTTPYNVACREASGRWIAPLGHDDAFDEDHIEILLELACKERAELAYGQLRTLDAATGRELPNLVGRWPPEHSHIGMQGALYHRGLTAFEWDLNARFAGEPNDWNFTRRLWEAGVRFAFLDRPVTSYYYSPKDPIGQAWVRSARSGAAVGESDDADVDATPPPSHRTR
jgi:Glycosyl transferase family 2